MVVEGNGQMQGGYGKYLPDIDVADGVARLMNNMKIYTTVLKKFDGTKFVADIMAAAETQDYEALQLAAHTLKGAAANLSLKRFHEVSFAIEQCAKDKENPKELLDELQTALQTTSQAITGFLAEAE